VPTSFSILRPRNLGRRAPTVTAAEMDLTSGLPVPRGNLDAGAATGNDNSGEIFRIAPLDLAEPE
jgi:hypothetical protein